MDKVNLSRRNFLRKGGLTAAGALALTLTGVTVSSNAWSMQLNKLNADVGEALSQMTRVLYPHSRLSDVYYDACVEGLDAAIKDNPELLLLLTEGVQHLDAVYGMPFTKLSAKKRLAAVSRLEDTPFFNKVRGHAVVALYNNEKIWSKFGYEGPSFPHGGYLERGFNDIAWLPSKNK